MLENFRGNVLKRRKRKLTYPTAKLDVTKSSETNDYISCIVVSRSPTFKYTLPFDK